VLTVSQGGFTLFFLALLAQLLVLAWTVSRLVSSPRRRIFKLVLLLISAGASLQAGNALGTISTISSLNRYQQVADQLAYRLEQDGQDRVDLAHPESQILTASAVRESGGTIRVDLGLAFGRRLAYFPKNSMPIENASCYHHLKGAWYQYSGCNDSESPDVVLY
jgi:hypothetical protein